MGKSGLRRRRLLRRIVRGLSPKRLTQTVKRWRFPAVVLTVFLLGGLVFLTPWGCTPKSTTSEQAVPLADRTIRVRLFQGEDKLTLTASQEPIYFTTANTVPTRLGLPRNQNFNLFLAPDGWRVGTASLGKGELILRPAAVGSLAVNGAAYRGQYRLVPLADGRTFDVVNDVDVDDYLKGVISRELFPNWHAEAYRAQAIVARTYALYEKRLPREQRHFDVHADTRSQVYGGISAETGRSRDGVDHTAGIVVAYGEAGNERIFKAYFSSCCGGISQSNAAAFNEPWLEPLGEQNVGALCSAGPRFNWGPVIIGREELTRRVRLWGANPIRNHPIRGIGLVRAVEIAARNKFGRPTRFMVIDVDNHGYQLGPEEFRWAVNTDARDAGTTLPSAFMENIINESDRIRFVGGHGHGHGVGMCQWCCQARAVAGMRHEDIVTASFPGAKLVRAY
jgi:stage II sporulation protein D